MGSWDLISDAIEMIIILDGGGRILDFNRSAGQELGYGQELCGDFISRILRQPFLEQESGRRLPLEPKLELTESVWYRKNDSCFPVHMKLCPCEAGYELMGINITRLHETDRQLKRVKEEASESIRVRNEFVANVTHELRTPLNGIRGHLSNLLETELTHRQKRTLDIISGCCVNMAAIINNILDFSKLEAGKFSIEKETFHFLELVNQTVEVNITAVNEKGLHMIVNIADDIPDLLVGDRLRLAQILNNLLSNAIKFTSVGYISLEVTKSLEYDNVMELFFMVKDTGIGISKQEQDKLFKSFSQVDASITRRYGGTGLGLVITKQLVELMGGSVFLDSEKGKGSVFSFTVKLNTCQDAQPEGKRPEPEKKESVLQLREPSTDIAKYVEMEHFFEFGSAENAQEIRNKMEKLVICMELDAWDKAELFADNLKTLLKQGPKELQRAVFRLEMSVRKEDYAVSMERYEGLKALLEETIGGM